MVNNGRSTKNWNRNGVTRLYPHHLAGKIMGIERRRSSRQGIARRWKTFLPIALDSSQGSARGHVLNLSAGGALVHSATAHRVGTIVRLTLGDFQLSGRVAWRDGERFGVAFMTALPDFTVERAIAVPKIALVLEQLA
ncbi:PilZ domain-containing protein [Sphingomonas sp. RT2P30]|uniref:PilZ domain-containing protein n=1 Tax=Parasphingomonas halimpatiens TaxID=3096162 RepID=UPI002FCC01A4